MSSVDKIKVNESTYNISPSSNGTMNGFTSNDAVSPTVWTDVDIVSSSDSNSTIFSKVTTMIKNVRWLYSKLGTTDFSATGQSTVTGALSALQTGLGNKAARDHSHATNTLPVSSQYVNSNDYVPTSALMYSMQADIDALDTAVQQLQFELDNPNKRYESISLGTWSSVSDVDTFLSRFNHGNVYKDGNTKLALGNYVTIQDGTYNAIWEIAGFDLEHNQTAADGTVYDNGYGICLIPKTYATTGKWNLENTLTGAYMSSTMHTSVIPSIHTELRYILGSHLVQRNVLLSSDIDSDWHSNAYTWTTSYATLMSVGQMTGTFAANRNKYDDGEANYKLPLFDHEKYYTSSTLWTRCISGGYGSYGAYTVYSNNTLITAYNVVGTYGVRPLIYIR